MVIIIRLILKPPFLDLELSITNGIVSNKRTNRDDFNFIIHVINLPILVDEFPRTLSYCVYFSRLIRFARICSNFSDFNNRNYVSTVN